MLVFISILYLCLGTLCLWLGITFMNGHLFAVKLALVYETLQHPLWRMFVALPILGCGHLLFALAMKTQPAIAAPGGIILTVIPPIIYGLWLIETYPNTKIIIAALLLIGIAIFLGYELKSLAS